MFYVQTLPIQGHSGKWYPTLAGSTQSNPIPITTHGPLGERDNISFRACACFKTNSKSATKTTVFFYLLTGREAHFSNCKMVFGLVDSFRLTNI